MKNMKKISLVSFLACASLAGGIMMANTEAPEVAEPYFKMEVGAQVRVPDEVEGELVKDGLRFTAKMSDSFWQEKGGLEGKSVGMFIMPAAYASKPINYDNCFGESACYYWNGVEAKTETAKEILHVDSYAYEEYKGAPELTMKASIWNMNAENLDREFVAVAYLTDGTNYWFAETAQGAKTVSVAQKALLNPEDEIYSVDGASAKVEEAYVKAYLGEGKEVAYTENVYKETASGVYTLIGSEEKTVTMTTYNTEATVKAFEGYKPFDYKNNKQNRVVLFDGSTEVDTYYNYAANRAVIWDDDEYTSDYTVGTMSCDTMKSIVGTANHMNNFNNEVDSVGGADGSKSYPADPQKVIYEGDSGSLNNSRDNAWDGIAWNFKDIGFATNTFSYILYTEKGFTMGAIEVFGYGEDMTKYRWVNPTSCSIVTLELFGEDTNYNTDDDYKTFNSGLYKVTVTFAQEMRYLVGWSFRTNVSNNGHLYIDNLCAEKSVYLESKQWNIPSTFEDGASEISFAEGIKAKSTYLYEGDESAITTSAQYQVFGASEWSDLTAVDGKYTIPVTDQAATYMVKLTATNGEDSHSKTFSIVNDKYEMLDFEYDASLEGSYNGWREEISKDSTCIIMEGGANNGSHALRSYSNSTLSWDGMVVQYRNITFSKVGFWLTANASFDQTIEIMIKGLGWQATTFKVKAGTHYYEFANAKGEVTGELQRIDWKHSSNQCFFFDDIIFKY